MPNLEAPERFDEAVRAFADRMRAAAPRD